MTVAEKIAAERELGALLEKYPGKWVAVVDYEVVAHADALGELLEQIESEGLEEDATILQVPAEQTAACFY